VTTSLLYGMCSVVNSVWRRRWWIMSFALLCRTFSLRISVTVPWFKRFGFFLRKKRQRNNTEHKSNKILSANAHKNAIGEKETCNYGSCSLRFFWHCTMEIFGMLVFWYFPPFGYSIFLCQTTNDKKVTKDRRMEILNATKGYGIIGIPVLKTFR